METTEPEWVLLISWVEMHLAEHGRTWDQDQIEFVAKMLHEFSTGTNKILLDTVASLTVRLAMFDAKGDN
jgi:hypothetical protein